MGALRAKQGRSLASEELSSRREVSNNKEHTRRTQSKRDKRQGPQISQAPYVISNLAAISSLFFYCPAKANMRVSEIGT